MSTPSTVGRPPKTSRAAILDAAMSRVDREGVEGLTMRRLGGDLGVDAMAIYRHFPNKTALLDAMLGRLFAEVHVPRRGEVWEEDFSALADAARESMLHHPGALVLLATRPPVAEEAFELMERCVAILLAAGLSEEDAADGADCLGRLLIGHLVAEGGTSPGAEAGDEVEERHGEAQEALDPGRFPALAALAQAGVEHDPDRLFALAVEGLSLALERRIERAAA